MRISAVEDLRKYLIQQCALSHKDKVELFIGSRQYGNDTLKLPIHALSISTGTLHSPDYVGLMWAEKGSLRTRSLLDMNIPENGYNDYRVFTTEEEMIAYSIK